MCRGHWILQLQSFQSCPSIQTRTLTRGILNLSTSYLLSPLKSYNFLTRPHIDMIKSFGTLILRVSSWLRVSVILSKIGKAQSPLKTPHMMLIQRFGKTFGTYKLFLNIYIWFGRSGIMRYMLKRTSPRKMLIELLRPRCNLYEEDIGHGFCDCLWAQHVWFHPQLRIRKTFGSWRDDSKSLASNHIFHTATALSPWSYPSISRNFPHQLVTCLIQQL